MYSIIVCCLFMQKDMRDNRLFFEYIKLLNI